jgi:tRNA pseudouridine55 synthase
MLGILVIDKPPGMTSHDVVDRVRRRLGTRRVGHAGSLDPMATGVLVVAVGPATRFLQYLPLEPKEYEATIAFGTETDTQDAEGSVLATAPVPSDLDRRVEELLPEFLGPIEQLPPMFSAVKRAGKPLYAYARKGEEVDRTPRTVYVDVFEPLGDGRYRIVCSGGTYVRTLAHDLGRRLGCGAHLGALRRTRAGKFSLAEAIGLDEAGPLHLVQLAEALEPMPVITLDLIEVEAIREGRSIEHPALAPLVALADPDGRVFSVARADGNRLQPQCVIPSEAMQHGLV